MIISTEELKEHFRSKQIAKLKGILSTNKIPFFVDKKGNPFTTSEALNYALGIKEIDNQDDGFNLDHLSQKNET
jgi:hypothetical protein